MNPNLTPEKHLENAMPDRKLISIIGCHDGHHQLSRATFVCLLKLSSDGLH